jgi:hypothetical protein
MANGEIIELRAPHLAAAVAVEPALQGHPTPK